MDLFDLAVASKLAGGGGGGGSSYKLLAEDDVVVSNPSSSGSGSIVKAFNLDPAIVFTSDKIIYVRTRIKSNYVKPHTICADSFSWSPNASIGKTSDMPFRGITYDLKADGTWHTSNFGFTPVVLVDGTVNIYAKYDATYDINGTYHVEVYSLEWPDGVSPFYIE